MYRINRWIIAFTWEKVRILNIVRDGVVLYNFHGKTKTAITTANMK